LRATKIIHGFKRIVLVSTFAAVKVAYFKTP